MSCNEECQDNTIPNCGDEVDHHEQDVVINSDSSTLVTKPIVETLSRIPELINKEDVTQMINFQVDAIDKLEGINKSLTNCNLMAQSKLSTTMKLFKRTAKQMGEAKRDLDIIYQKILNLKSKINANAQSNQINPQSKEDLSDQKDSN